MQPFTQLSHTCSMHRYDQSTCNGCILLSIVWKYNKTGQVASVRGVYDGIEYICNCFCYDKELKTLPLLLVIQYLPQLRIGQGKFV